MKQKLLLCAVGVLLLAACKKEVTQKSEPADTVVVNNAKANPAPGWNGDPVQLSWNSNGSSFTISSSLGSTTVNGLSYTTPGLTAPTTFTIKAANGSASETITVPVYTVNMTTYCREKWWTITSAKRVHKDSVGYPSAYLDIKSLVPPGKYSYNPNGSATQIVESGAGAGTFTQPQGTWYFMSNETKIHRGVDNDWDIISLTNTQLNEKQEKNNYITFVVWQKV